MAKFGKTRQQLTRELAISIGARSSEPRSAVPGDVVLIEDFCAIASLGKDDPAHATFTAAYYADTGSFVQSSVDCITLCTKQPDYADQAFRLKMTTGADLIAGKFKLRGASYYYGVPADKVRQFSAPKDKKPIDEASIYVALKASNENVSSIVPLENTETVPFKTQFESILAHSPSFIESKLTSVGALENHAKRGYAKNIKAASTVAEKVERQVAKEKAAGDKGGVESAGGGRDAGERWAEVRANALSYEAVLELPFAQRFVVLDPKKPEEAQAALKGHPYEKELVADLPEFINYMSGRPSALSAQLTPFSKLLTEKFSLAPTAPESESDANLGAARARKPPAAFEAGAASSKRKQGAAEGGAAKKARGRPAKAAVHAEGKENSANGARITSKQAEALYKDLDKLRKGVPTGI